MSRFSSYLVQLTADVFQRFSSGSQASLVTRFSCAESSSSHSFMSRQSVLAFLLVLLTTVFGVGNAWGETSTLTFTAEANGSGTADDNVAWTVTSDGTESTFDNTKGIHYGTKSAQVKYIKLTTSGISGTITKVVVNASAASGVSATASVTVGGNAFGGDAQSLSTTATDYTFTGSASGEIVVTVTKPSKAAKAIYCKSVAVTYSTGGGSSETVVKTLKSIAVSGMTTSYEVGAAFSFDGTCTATYSVTVNDEPQDDEQKTVTPTSVSTPDMTEAGNKTITVTYVEDEVEESTTYNITVAAAEGDKLTVETTGVTGTSYADWKEVAGASGAVYAGQSAGSNSSIQLRSKNSNSGIISTTSGGVIRKVKVVWNSNTSSGATLNVYGKSAAYTAASELYGLETQGTLLGTIVKGTSTELEITGDYEYVGVCSNSGAMYLTSITFVWGAGKELSSIAVKTNPDKVSYNINDEFDATGLVITATYDDSSTDDIAYTGNEDKFLFSGFSSAAAAAAQAITVTYGGKSTTFNVEIKDVTLQTVTVSGTPTTTSYTAGDVFDPTDLTVMGHYSDNSDAPITSGITWSYPDDNATLAVGQTSIRVVATVDEIASEPYTFNGLTVTAAPLVASWVASVQEYADKTDMTEETVTFGPSNNFSIVFGAGTNTQNAPKYYTTGTAVRAYGGNTFALSSSDFKFKEIVISFSSGEGSNDITTNVGTYDAGTWTGNSKEVTFTIGGTTGHRRIASITVTYEAALPSVETPTFSVAEGTYFETQNVTITTATAGATIYYTTDGTEPTTGSSVYSDPIAVSTNMTIKAIAVKDDLENSAVASATYAMGPIFNSLEDLVAADLTSNTMVKVSFSNVAIKKIDTNKKYVTFDIQKEEKDIEIYFSAETLPTTWVVGGTLSGTILAPWKRFVQSSNFVCWELAPESGWQWTNLTYNSPITKTIDHVTVTGTAIKTAYVDGEVFDPAGLIVTLYYTDETNEVVTDGITWAPTTALTEGTTSVNVTATVNDVTSAAHPVDVTVTAIPTKTIAEFIAAGGGRCYLVGVVSNLTNSDKNCTLTDNSGEILLYNISQNGAVTDFVTLDVEEGDRIKVIATTYQVYNQKDEVVAPEFVEELAPEVVAVTGVTVAPTTTTVKVGKTITLTATVLPALASNTNVSWESDATGVATVENGVVTGVAEGTAHITVTTEENSFTATATITVEEGIDFAAGDWVLVKDAAELTAGSYVIIAAAESDKALSTTQNNNNRSAQAITKIADMLKYETAPAIFELKVGNKENTFAFYDEDNDGYIYAASSSSNYLKTETVLSDNSSWVISVTSAGVASATAQGTNTRNQLKNNGDLFSCYSSGQADIALYKYEEHKFTLTYNKNTDAEVSGMPEAQRVDEDNEVTVSTEVPTCGSKIFTGWNTQADGEGETKAANAVLTLSNDLTLFAQWRTPVTVTISYDANEGSGSMDADAEQVEGSTYTIKANEFERDGYLFAGWKAYDAGENELTITNGKFTVPATDVTVKAQWQSATDSKWVLVEHLSQLAIGDKVIIAAADFEYALSTTQNSNNRGAVEISKRGKLLIPNADVQQLTLGKDGSNYTFNTGAGYLYAASSGSNYLRTQETNDDNGKWTITLAEGGVATITAQGSNTRNVMSYNTSHLFACYASDNTQKDIVIYKYLDIDPEDASTGYERTDLILSGIGTICLPYNVEASDRFGGVFYMPSHKTSGFANFIEETGTLRAGKAYIFVAENEFIRLKYSGTVVSEPLSNVADTRGLIGTFTGISAGDLTGKYVIADNKLRKCGSGAYLNAYRAYLDLDLMPEEELTINEPANAPARRRLGIGGGASGVTTDIVDVQGDSLSGIKVLLNGQLFIIRGEKMYDATGRLVK